MRISNSARIVWSTLTGSCFAGTMLLVLAWIVPYRTLDLFFDALSKDGNAEFFTHEFYLRARIPLGICVLAALGISILLATLRSRGMAALQRLGCWLEIRWVRLKADTKQLLSHLSITRLSSGELIVVAVLTLLAAWIRLQDIHHPMGYDESYTYVSFASQPIGKLLSDYHLPNNHVFHSLLVHISTRLFGEQPCAVRFPAYAAGVLMVPGIYFLARRLFNASAALLSACFVLPAPWLIQFSVNARGYTLVALLALVAFWLAGYGLRHRNRCTWILLVLVSGMGFYTVPVMVYPFGAWVTWLLLSCLAGDFSQEYRTRRVFITYLAIASVSTGIFTLLLYSPILIYSGPGALFANEFVASLPWKEFVRHLIEEGIQTWNDWFLGVPVWIRAAAAVGFLASVVLNRRLSSYKVPAQLAATAWIGLAVLVQKPEVFSRMWVWLLPLFLMWSAAGIAGLLDLIPRPKRQGMKPSAVSAGIGFAAVCAFTFLPLIRQPINHYPEPGDAESTALHFKEILQPGDVISVTFPIDAELMYYTQIHGIPHSYYYRPKDADRLFQRAFLVVCRQCEQTVEDVLSSRGPDASRLDLSTLNIESDFGVYTVYRIPAAGVLPK